MKKFIEPTIGSGFRDYLPKDMIPRQKLLDTIRNVFERFGFLPLDTPGIEKEEILTGGDPDYKMQIFRIGHQRGEEDFALRFDLTIPLARVISMNRDLERPFKRYQMGKVWRGEKPQAGRFREFIQFDADIVGAPSMLADAEIISLVYATMIELGFTKFIIRVNNRKILNGLAEYIGFDYSSVGQVLRSIDKFDKIAWENVTSELKEKTKLDDNQILRLKHFIELKEDDKDITLSKIESLMVKSSIAVEGVNELKMIRRYLKAFGIPDDKWSIDLSVARGLGYYTGTVFETILSDIPKIGSVLSGGRYDNLVSRFGDQSVPAVGASVGVDRLFAAMEQLNLITPHASTVQVLVLNFDSVAEKTNIEIAAVLRKNKIPSELFIGKSSNIKEQLGYALRQEIPIVIIIGEKEQGLGVAQIKHLPSRTQIEVPLDQIIQKTKDLIASNITKSNGEYNI